MGNVLAASGGRGAEETGADEARALFRMNFYEISRHKTRAGPIGTYVRTLHPDGLLLLLLLVLLLLLLPLLLLLLLLLLSINRLGTGWAACNVRN